MAHVRARTTVAGLLAGALAWTGAATAPDPAAAAGPPLTIRVPHVAEPGAVPPAVVVADQELVGTAYTVSEGGQQVAAGTLAAVEDADAGTPDDRGSFTGTWSHAATADLSAIDEPGSYTVTVGGVTSVPIEVTGDAYADVLDSLLDIYDSNADGNEPSSYHGASHLNDRRSRIRNGPRKGDRIDVTGGWMDSGDTLKFTITIGYASLMLDLAARNQPALAERLEDLSDVGVRWLLKAHPGRGVFVGMVGDELSDHGEFRDPAGDDTYADPENPTRAKKIRTRPTMVITTQTGGSDFAGMAAAALATAAQRATGMAQQRLIKSAEEWLAFANRIGKPWQECCYSQGDALGHLDDVAVASAALWRVTGEASYARKALRALKQRTEDGANNWLVAADGYEMAGIAAADLCGVLGTGPAADPAVADEACRILDLGGWGVVWKSTTENAFGRAGANQWGSARQSESGAAIAMLAAATGRDGAEDWEAAALRGTGWLLGVNQWGLRFQVGYGVHHPHHWESLDGPDRPLGAIPGGPAHAGEYELVPDVPTDPGVYDTEVELYQDRVEDYVSNEISIAYNAPAVLHFALLSDG